MQNFEPNNLFTFQNFDEVHEILRKCLSYFSTLKIHLKFLTFYQINLIMNGQFEQH